MKHKHKWKLVGYYNAGWGISTDCPVHWCTYCGAIHRNRAVKPKVRRGK